VNTCMKLIIANWKMNLGLAESRELAKKYKESFAGWKKTSIVACPSEFALTVAAKELKGSPVALGAQDCFWEAKGAYTGEVSPMSLAEIGCRYVLLGHSERRQYLGESCRMVILKLKQASAAAGLVPVVCVGESLATRRAGKHLAFVDGQLKRALAGVKIGRQGLAIAYEPLWAIGTGLAASRADAEEMHGAIRHRLGRILGQEIGDRTPILYGGSVDISNAQDILSSDLVGGLLVGGASLDATKFKKIANFS